MESSQANHFQSKKLWSLLFLYTVNTSLLIVYPFIIYLNNQYKNA